MEDTEEGGDGQQRGACGVALSLTHLVLRSEALAVDPRVDVHIAIVASQLRLGVALGVTKVLRIFAPTLAALSPWKE